MAGLCRVFVAPTPHRPSDTRPVALTGAWPMRNWSVATRRWSSPRWTGGPWKQSRKWRSTGRESRRWRRRWRKLKRPSKSRWAEHILTLLLSSQTWNPKSPQRLSRKELLGGCFQWCLPAGLRLRYMTYVGRSRSLSRSGRLMKTGYVDTSKPSMFMLPSLFCV